MIGLDGATYPWDEMVSTRASSVDGGLDGWSGRKLEMDQPVVRAPVENASTRTEIEQRRAEHQPRGCGEERQGGIVAVLVARVRWAF